MRRQQGAYTYMNHTWTQYLNFSIESASSKKTSPFLSLNSETCIVQLRARTLYFDLKNIRNCFGIQEDSNDIDVDPTLSWLYNTFQSKYLQKLF
jgi:hypothetical protein